MFFLSFFPFFLLSRFFSRFAPFFFTPSLFTLFVFFLHVNGKQASQFPPPVVVLILVKNRALR